MLHKMDKSRLMSPRTLLPVSETCILNLVSFTGWPLDINQERGLFPLLPCIFHGFGEEKPVFPRISLWHWGGGSQRLIIMAKKIRKGWAYINGHYAHNGKWIPPHWSLWRQLLPYICFLFCVWAVALWLVSGLSNFLLLALLPFILLIASKVQRRRPIARGHTKRRTEEAKGKPSGQTTRIRLHLPWRTRANPKIRLYEELCHRLKEFEVQENVLDMDKFPREGKSNST